MFNSLQSMPTMRRHRRAIGAAMLTLVLALLVSLIGSEAQACPPGASITASISHKLASKSVLKAKAVIASQTMKAVSTPKSGSVRGIGACCGGSHGFGCPQSGCACCAVAVFEPAPGVFIEQTVSDYVLAHRVDATSASPDPNYRPPCLA